MDKKKNVIQLPWFLINLLAISPKIEIEGNKFYPGLL